MDAIIEKIKKIKRLADEGFAGEAKAAQFQLEKLLEKHNLSIEDLFEERIERRMFKVPKGYKQLFIQTLSSIIGDRYKGIWTYKRKPSEYYVELTDVEYIDCEQAWSFHHSQLKKELAKSKAVLEKAYYHKHVLFNNDYVSTGEEKQTMTLEEYLAMKAQMNNLENVSLKKQLA